MEKKADQITIEYDQLYNIIRRRRTVRNLKSDPIPEDFVGKILEAGRWAMSGANSQPWEFLVITDAEIRRKVFDAYHEANTDFVFWLEQMRIKEMRHPAYRFGGDPHEQWKKARSGMIKSWWKAPVMILILGDGRRQWGTVTAAFTPGRHASHLTDGLTIAATLMHLAADSLGLGAQHVTIHVDDPIKRVLGIPDLIMVHHILPIGFPATPPPDGVRRPLEDMVHYNHYDESKYMSNADIIDFLLELRGKTKGGYGRR